MSRKQMTTWTLVRLQVLSMLQPLSNSTSLPKSRWDYAFDPDASSSFGLSVPSRNSSQKTLPPVTWMAAMARFTEVLGECRIALRSERPNLGDQRSLMVWLLKMSASRRLTSTRGMSFFVRAELFVPASGLI